MSAVNGSDSTSYFSQTADGGGLAVRLAESVIDRMNVQIMRGYGATKRRGAEVGGLLIGRLENAGTPSETVVIDDFEAVPCEYSFGLSYHLSPDDEDTFAAAVEKWRAEAGKEAYVVGFFRSHTRDSLTPDEFDATLLERYLPKSAPVILLIKPYGTRNGLARFFVPKHDPRHASTFAEFEFATAAKRQSPSQENSPETRTPPPPTARSAPRVAPVPAGKPSVAAPARPVTSDATAHQPTPAPKPKPVEPAPPRLRAPRPAAESSPAPPAAAAPHGSDSDRLLAKVLGPRERADSGANSAARPYNRPLFQSSLPSSSPLSPVLMQIAFGVVLFAMGALAGFQYAGGSLADLAPGRALPFREPYSMGLTASRKGQTVAVEWNRYAQPIRHAARGTLVITDGPETKAIPLGQNQLRSGVRHYQATTDQVSVRLEVHVRENGLVSETIVSPSRH